MISKRPKNGLFILLILALPVLLIAVNLGEGRPFYNPSTRAATTDLVSFTNSEGIIYAFSSPSKYKIQEVSSGYTTVLNENGESLVEVTIEADRGDYLDNASQFSINRYKVMHEIEWKDSQAKREFINKVVNSRSYDFTNPNGIKGYEIYLTIESIDKQSGKIEERGEVGPLFAFDVSRKNLSSPVIFAHGYGDSGSEKIEVLRTIADTLQIK